MADGVVFGPGEGERLNERIVVKLEVPQISVNEVDVGPGFMGAGPHFHREHTDAFYVLEGTLEFINGTETVRGEAGTIVAVPPGIVHGFKNAGPGGRDTSTSTRPMRSSSSISVTPSPAGRIPGTASTSRRPPGRQTRRSRRRTAESGWSAARGTVNTIKAVTTELSMFILEFDERWEGVDPHSHDDHVDSFYVLDGEVDFELGDETVRAGPGFYVAAPIGVTHGFRPIGPARLLNIHAPDAGFAGRVRGR